MTSALVPTARKFSMPIHWAVKYLSIPYKDQGRSFDGVDCWGLVWLVYTTEDVAPIPSYGTMTEKQVREALQVIQRDRMGESWVQVVAGAEREFDVVLMNAPMRLEEGERLRMIPFHVGIVTSPGYMMHVEPRAEVCVVPFRDNDRSKAHPTIGRRVIGIHRYKAGGGEGTDA